MTRPGCGGHALCRQAQSRNRVGGTGEWQGESLFFHLRRSPGGGGRQSCTDRQLPVADLRAEVTDGDTRQGKHGLASISETEVEIGRQKASRVEVREKQRTGRREGSSQGGKSQPASHQGEPSHRSTISVADSAASPLPPRGSSRLNCLLLACLPACLPTRLTPHTAGSRLITLLPPPAYSQVFSLPLLCSRHPLLSRLLLPTVCIRQLAIDARATGFLQRLIYVHRLTRLA